MNPPPVNPTGIFDTCQRTSPTGTSVGAGETAPADGQSRVVCSWCGADLGPSATETDSHGICNACAEKHFNFTIGGDAHAGTSATVEDVVEPRPTGHADNVARPDGGFNFSGGGVDGRAGGQGGAQISPVWERSPKVRFPGKPTERNHHSRYRVRPAAEFNLPAPVLASTAYGRGARESTVGTTSRALRLADVKLAASKTLGESPIPCTFAATGWPVRVRV